MMKAVLSPLIDQGALSRVQRMASALAAAGLLLAVSAPLTLASGNTSKNASVNIRGEGHLVTGPSAVTEIEVNYSCAPGTTTSGALHVTLSQVAVENSVTVVANCNDKTHTETVFLPAAYTKGSANANATVENDNSTAFATQSREVQLN